MSNFRFKNHIELGKELDIIDTERAAKVAGARFYYLKNEAAMLDIALQKFAIDNLAKKGFSIMSPPLMLRKEAYEGVTNLDVFEERLETYRHPGNDRAMALIESLVNELANVKVIH